MFAVVSMSDLSSSDGLFSGAAAFPYLVCLIANLISSIVGGLTAIGMSV